MTRAISTGVADYRNARAQLDSLAEGQRGRTIHSSSMPGSHRKRARFRRCHLYVRRQHSGRLGCRYLTMNGKRRDRLFFNHGSMANAMLQAVGPSQPTAAARSSRYREAGASP